MGMTDYAELSVRVQPRAAANEIVGWREGVLAVRLTAPPLEGAANKACILFLATTLGVRRADVELISGAKSRDKRFRISGLTPEELTLRIERLL
jgi:uncharacterized protein